MRLRFKEIQRSKEKLTSHVTLEEFQEAYCELCTRPDVYFLLVQLSKDRECLDAQDLRLFLESEQGLIIGNHWGLLGASSPLWALCSWAWTRSTGLGWLYPLPTVSWVPVIRPWAPEYVPGHEDAPISLFHQCLLPLLPAGWPSARPSWSWGFHSSTAGWLSVSGAWGYWWAWRGATIGCRPWYKWKASSPPPPSPPPSWFYYSAQCPGSSQQVCVSHLPVSSAAVSMPALLTFPTTYSCTTPKKSFWIQALYPWISACQSGRSCNHFALSRAAEGKGASCRKEAAPRRGRFWRRGIWGGWGDWWWWSSGWQKDDYPWGRGTGGGPCCSPAPTAKAPPLAAWIVWSSRSCSHWKSQLLCSPDECTAIPTAFPPLHSIYTRYTYEPWHSLLDPVLSWGRRGRTAGQWEPRGAGDLY